MTTKKLKYSKQRNDVPYRAGEGSIERRARNPTKGLRLRLRTALRAAGVTGKFRTDERRGGSLVVLGHNELITLPFTEFEGYPVRSVIQTRAG